MQWQDIRITYPNQWLVIEPIESETTLNHWRVLKRIAVMERCSTGDEAFQSCRRLHPSHSGREFYFIHTSREELEIYERNWVGVRRSDAAPIA